MLASFICLYIGLTLAIGFWASRRIVTTTDFTLAGKQLPTGLVGVTIFATWFGPEMIMGVPGQFVERGVMGIVTDQFGAILCLLLIACFYARRLYRMNIVTLSDFFRLRYSASVELASSVIIVSTYFFWIAAQFVALAYLFQPILGTTIPEGILLGGAVVVVYTYIGGMWAVTLTDLLQSILIVVGLSIVLVSVLGETGGLQPLLADQPAGFFDLFPRAGFYRWTDYLAMWMAFGVGALPAQEIYQRVFSAHSATAGARGVLLSAFLLFTITCIPLTVGLAAAHLHPELMGSDEGQNLIPAVVTRYTSVPVQLLFFGALISAILSTSSGAMLSPATIIGENLLKPYLPQLSDKRLLLWTRLSVILVALISCVLAFNNSNIHGLVVASAVLLMVCLFAPLTFGLFWKRASTGGAWAAILVGGLSWLVCDWVGTRVDPTIYGTVGSCCGMVVGSWWWPRPLAALL